MRERQRLRTRALELLGLYTVTVSGPLFIELSGEPKFFTSRQTSPSAFVAFALIVAVAPPLVLALAAAAAGIASKRAGAVVHAVWIALLALAGLGQIVSGLPSALAVVLALAGAAALSSLYLRTRPLRAVAAALAPLPLVAVLLFVFTGAAASEVRGADATPVVMLVLDEATGTSLLDARNQIDPQLFPNLARLVHDGTYYRNFTAAADETTRVMAGLMTGDKWHEHAKPTAAEYPHNLFTALGGTYRIHANEAASDFCPPGICQRRTRSGLDLLKAAGLIFAHRVLPGGLSDGLTSRRSIVSNAYDPQAAARQVTDTTRVHKAPLVLAELGEGRRPAHFEHWLRRIDGNVGRTLYFKHLLMPHVPWQYLPDGRLYRHRDDWIRGMSDPPAFGDRWLLIQDYQRHILQFAYVDKLVGQMVAKLKELGIYNKALVVITADNGESFLHKGHDRHVADAETFTDIASTPLFIKYPHQKHGGYDDRHFRTFDLLPTIADTVGIKLHWKLLGRSLRDPAAQVPDTVYVRREQHMEGSTFHISLAGYERKRRQALRAKLRTFPGGDVWRPGPDPRLIGRAVPGAPRANAVSAHLNPALGRVLTRVRPASNFMPSNVTGTLTGSGAGRPLALAVDGRIAAVGWSAKLAGDPHTYFTFMVEPSYLSAGRNRVALYEIRAGGRFRRIPFV